MRSHSDLLVLRRLVRPSGFNIPAVKGVDAPEVCRLAHDGFGLGLRQDVARLLVRRWRDGKDVALRETDGSRHDAQATEQCYGTSSHVEPRLLELRFLLLLGFLDVLLVLACGNVLLPLQRRV